MIKPGEIQKKAQEDGVRDQQIEKDYVLSWLLQGISQYKGISDKIAFKGGTVLKKVYFEDYRYSEDLDFTLLDNAITNRQIFDWFDKVFKYVKEEANIPLEIIDNNEHQDGGINFYISYAGPLGGTGAGRRIKVDISRSEHLAFAPTYCPAIINYSDLEDHKILCYTLEEVIVEKLRSVMQRMQARDFYDIWYLVEVYGMDVTFYHAEFINKTRRKGLDPGAFHLKLAQRLPQYKGRWKSSMSDQIHDLPDFEQVEREVMRHLKRFEI